MINLIFEHFNLPGDRLEDKHAAEAAGVQFMDEHVVRNRFRPGIYKFQGMTLAQVEFLGNVEINK